MTPQSSTPQSSTPQSSTPRASTPRFSANLGFLWTDRALPDAIVAAKAAGFDAVECHMPYQWPAADVLAALETTGLAMVSLNTRIGDPDAGDLGVAAVPGRETEAAEYIEQAIEYAEAIGCGNVSIVAGRTGRTDAAEAVYRTNLAMAAARAATSDITVLIEPLNTDVASDYHLVGLDAGLATIAAVGASNLKLMVDCFHTQTMDGNLTERCRNAIGHIGHVQISSVPDRSEPDAGEIDYRWLIEQLMVAGYAGPFGAEYHPRTTVEAGLGWLDDFRTDREVRS